MIFYSYDVTVKDLKEGKKKDGTPWYYAKFGDSNGTLCCFCSSEAFSKLKKGGTYTLTTNLFYSKSLKGLNLFIKECDSDVN